MNSLNLCKKYIFAGFCITYSTDNLHKAQQEPLALVLVARLNLVTRVWRFSLLVVATGATNGYAALRLRAGLATQTKPASAGLKFSFLLVHVRLCRCRRLGELCLYRSELYSPKTFKTFS